MKTIDPKRYKELMQYPKEDIVEELLRWDFGFNVANSILGSLSRKRLDELYKKSEEASIEARKAFDKWIAYRSEMIKRYGDGEKVNLCDIPQKDFDKLVRLEEDWHDKEKKSRAAGQRFDRFCARGGAV